MAGCCIWPSKERRPALHCLPTGDGFRVGEGLSGDDGLHVPSLSSLLKKSVECFDEGMASKEDGFPFGKISKRGAGGGSPLWGVSGAGMAVVPRCE